MHNNVRQNEKCGPFEDVQDIADTMNTVKSFIRIMHILNLWIKIQSG